MALDRITLLVYGGSLEGGLNPTPLVAVGEAPDNFAPITPVMVKENRSWSITHTQDYTAYTLHTKENTTSNGQPGQLHICLLLPPTHRLANSKSPLDVLNETLDLFLDMIPDAIDDTSDFSNLLKQYPLEERPKPLPVMSGPGIAALRPDKNEKQLRALMSYSNYPDLEKVARLELGMNCKSTIKIKGVNDHQTIQEPSSTDTQGEQKPDTNPNGNPNTGTNKGTDSNKKNQNKGNGTKTGSTVGGGGIPLVGTGKGQKKKNGIKKAVLWTCGIVACLILLGALWTNNTETVPLQKNEAIIETDSSNNGLALNDKEKASSEDVPNDEQLDDDPLLAKLKKEIHQDKLDEEKAKREEDEKAKKKEDEKAKKNPSVKMPKTKAIGIVYDKYFQGGLRGEDKKAVEAVLTKQEINDIQQIAQHIKGHYRANPHAFNGIIHQLKNGNITVSAAKQQVVNIR